MKLWENIPKEEQDKIKEQVARENLLEDLIDVEYEAYYRKISPKEFIKEFLNNA